MHGAAGEGSLVHMCEEPTASSSERQSSGRDQQERIHVVGGSLRLYESRKDCRELKSLQAHKPVSKIGSRVSAIRA
jgi:hypothetical protein